MYRMNLAELPALRILEEHAEALRAEALALPEALFVPMPSRERYTGAWRAVLLDVGPWGAEFPGVDIPHNRSLCPVATALLSRLPVASVAGYLRLDPGATLATHTDLRDDDVLRAHVALVLPPEEAERWPIGRARLLDVRAPHGAKNLSEAARLTFTVDLRIGRRVEVGELGEWG
jgi:hypothetical protein